MLQDMKENHIRQAYDMSLSTSDILSAVMYIKNI